MRLVYDGLQLIRNEMQPSQTARKSFSNKNRENPHQIGEIHSYYKNTFPRDALWQWSLILTSKTLSHYQLEKQTKMVQQKI